MSENIKTESLHPFERELLTIYQKHKKTTLTAIEAAELSSNLDLNKINRAIDWLKGKKVLEVSYTREFKFFLSKTGRKALSAGLPEHRLLKWIHSKQAPISIEEVSQQAGLEQTEFKAAFGILKTQNFITISKGNVELTAHGKEAVTSNKESDMLAFLKTVEHQPQIQTETNKDILAIARKRTLIEQATTTVVSASLTDLGRQLLPYITGNEDYIDNLTREQIKSGEWKYKKLRPFKVDTPVPPYIAGKRHFYLQAIDFVRQIWIQMGFEEMTGPIVQTQFWNFDALFTPQDHPAREAQDTFFLKSPVKGVVNDENVARVAASHEHGGETGSSGWGYKFNRSITESLVLRTHTTCLSAKTVRKLRETGYPAKFFAVGRNFRNERIDWKHLAEFDQVEGIVIDPEVSFQDLLGYLKQFFRALGFSQARFRPAFYPYTEPSLGIEVLHPVRHEWMEIGGAGVFRPEVVVPLLGEDIPVLAWGPGIGRIVMERYNLPDIRKQYENDLDQLRNAPIWIR